MNYPFIIFYIILELAFLQHWLSLLTHFSHRCYMKRVVSTGSITASVAGIVPGWINAVSLHRHSLVMFYSEAEPNHLIFTKCQKHMGITVPVKLMFQRKVRWALASRGRAAPHSGIRSFLSLFRQLHLYLRLDLLPVHLNLVETQKDDMKCD